MKPEVKFLRAAADRIGGHLVMYYVGHSGKIRKFEPVKQIEEARLLIKGIIDTERFLKGDPIAEPSDKVIDPVEDEWWLYGHDDYAANKCKELLASLPLRRERLTELIERLEQVQLAFEAGTLSDNGKEFNELRDGYVRELSMW